MLSLLAHVATFLLFLILYWLGFLFPLANTTPLPPQENLRLTLIEPPTEPIPPPPQEQFIPTLEDQKIEEPDPQTPLISDRNTRLQSEKLSPQNNSPLPTMEGDPRSELSYREIPGQAHFDNQPFSQPTSRPSPAQPPKNSPSQEKIPQQPRPQTQPTEKTSQTPQKQKEKEASPAQKEGSQEDSPSPPPSSPNALPLLKPQPKQTQASPSQSQTPPHDTTTPASSPQPPPAFRLNKRRSDIQGSASIEGPASPAARETAEGRYKAKIYRAISSRWHLAVSRFLSTLSLGTIRIRFYIRNTGVIDHVEVIEDSAPGGSTNQILRTISMQAIIHSAPFEPFPETMKEKYGEGYWEDVNFVVQ